MTWTAVVLPAPFGPNNANTVPSGTSRSIPSRTRSLAVRLAQTGDLDGRRLAVGGHDRTAVGREASDVDLFQEGLLDGVGDHLEELCWDVIPKLIDVAKTSMVFSLGLPPPDAMPIPVQARQPLSGLPWESRISNVGVRSM